YGDLKDGFTTLAPYGPGVTAATKAKIAAKMKAMENGSFNVFTGPLYDQNGKLRVPKGQTMQVLKGGTNSLYGMNWLVKGVIGSHRGEGRAFRLRRRSIERRVGELSRRYGLHVDPRARIWQLSLGEQQRVEILKALYREARILILDEPTAVLTPQEAEVLFETLREMAGEGRTVIFISHKLHEVKAVADRVTVLRGGRSIATVPIADATPREL